MINFMFICAFVSHRFFFTGVLTDTASPNRYALFVEGRCEDVVDGVINDEVENERSTGTCPGVRKHRHGR